MTPTLPDNWKPYRTPTPSFTTRNDEVKPRKKEKDYDAVIDRIASIDPAHIIPCPKFQVKHKKIKLDDQTQPS